MGFAMCLLHFYLHLKENSVRRIFLFSVFVIKHGEIMTFGNGQPRVN